MKNKLNDLSQELFTTVTDAQNVLAEYIVPDSNISDTGVISRLLGILDNSELVRKMREAMPLKNENNFQRKEWADSPNIEYTLYSLDDNVLEVKYKDNNVYQYANVPLKIWEQLIKAPSIGSWMHRNLKGKFGFVRVN